VTLQAIISPATIADAAAIAEVNAVVWRESYVGLMPASILARVEPKPNQWADAIERATHSSPFLVAKVGTALAGFVVIVPQRDDALRKRGYGAEVSALYVRTECQRRGLGRKLFAGAVRTMQIAGSLGLSLWTLSGSRQSCVFYRSLGGGEIAHRVKLRDDEPIRETAFGWTHEVVARLFFPTA
jgi:GNAT superfamily N-acetyltransferase